MYGIRWTKTGNEVEFESGEMKGYLDMRDGTGEKGAYKGIPYYIEQLDHFAGVFAKAFNEGIYADGTQYIQGHAENQTSGTVRNQTSGTVRVFCLV